VLFRLRKLVGTVLLLVFVPVYALFALAVASNVLPADGPLIHLAFFLVAGLAWVPPAGLIVWWMFRPPADARPLGR
jgi:hypothetical protein